MKEKKNKKLKRIANKILACERNIINHINVRQNQAEIESLSEELTLEEMLFIDGYISRQGLTLR